MKKIFLSFLLISFVFVSQAQQTVDTYRKQAQALAQQQDFSGAVDILEQGLQQYPGNIELLKDEAYIAFLGRDYQHSMKIGKQLTGRDDADVQCFQILGLTYKAIADFKDADKLYKTGLKKFPNSAVLYGEYGDMLAQYDNKRGAIVQWEKGIAADANYSSNYYYAAKYYADNNNILWSCIYGEIFVNIESLTRRTDEIKSLLLNDYKNVLNGQSNIELLKKSGTDFEKAVSSSMMNAMETESGDVTPEMITAFRTRFILNWNHTNSNSYPYHLFSFFTQMLRDGLFDAYNQWLFGATINKDKFDNWVYTHDEEMQDFKQLQRNMLFKMPAEQYYGHS